VAKVLGTGIAIGCKPLLCWKAMTASLAPGPKLPSTPSDRNPVV